jgi:hypothetical protein
MTIIWRKKMKVIFLIFCLSIFSNVFAAQEWWGITSRGTCVLASSVGAPSPTAIMEEFPNKCRLEALDKEMGVYVLSCLNSLGPGAPYAHEMKKLYAKSLKGCNFAKGKKNYMKLDGAQKTIRLR